MIPNSRDEARNGRGEVVWYRQWPDAVDGMVDDNGTLRPLTADELAAHEAEQAALTADSNRRTIDAAITQALAELDALINAPDVPTVPGGTMSTANLSNGLRAMRESVQQNRTGIKRVARTLRHTIRLARGDFDGVD